MRKTLLTAALLCVFGACRAAAAVATAEGPVEGLSRNGIQQFLGIPFAAPPVGALRWMPPRPASKWTAVRQAKAFGPICAQITTLGPFAGPPNSNEDCLYLNVFTPDTKAKLPVLVWIHGGGFVSGSSQEVRPYDGEQIARRHNAVLVSMNHRLNVFGFLDLSQIGGERYATSANLGMLDLVAALEWVRDNIANFGGDPSSVTIFGQSGGARKVSTLLAMPAARGLFHKAAVLSGSHLRQILPDVSDRLANAVLQELQIGRGDISRLHQLPAAQILGAGIEAQRKLAQAATAAGGAAPNWGPVVDGRVLPTHAFDPAAPAISANVPMLIGNTFAEFGGGMNNPTAHEMTLDQLRERLQPTVGARANDVIAAYQKVFPGARPFEIWAVIFGTRSYRAAAVTQAELKAAQNAAPAFMYWFGWKTPVLDGRPLAYHCSDLAFWFDNIDLAAQATGGTDDARDLATKMSRALVAFARTGNPSHPGLPAWPAFTATGRATMVFENERVSVRADPDRDARKLI